MAQPYEDDPPPTSDGLGAHPYPGGPGSRSTDSIEVIMEGKTETVCADTLTSGTGRTHDLGS